MYLKIKFAACLFVCASVALPLHAQQDNSLKPSSKADAKSKKEDLKEKKELDKIHEKDKKKLAGQFSQKKLYKKDLKIKPATPAQGK